MKYIKSFVLLVLISVSGFCQSPLYVPVEIQEAYDNGTRSLDGKPGVDYWQNKSDYKINVTLDPPSGIITGNASITYYNNSPDTLDRIVLRTYQNLYKKGTIKDFPFDEDAYTDGIILNSLVINNKNIDLKIDSIAENTGTNLIIKNLRILPRKKSEINVTWNFKVSQSRIRMGQFDSTTFFIAYWYPQVAVYDDINGWDLNEYSGQTEFYNDFNSYDVKIIVPNYYGVWATGELKNAQEILSQQIYNRYTEAMNSSSVVNIITANDYLRKMAIFNNKNETNTWHYTASNVPDFTFGAAANYLWDGKSADGGNKKVFVSAIYNQNAKGFPEVCDIASKTVEMLSKDLPGVSYPYQKITVFNGSGGVESPMMVNQSAGGRMWIVFVTTHEVAHSYFPFYMGINEREYAWMDEGFTQMLTEYIQNTLDTLVDRRKRNVEHYLNYAGKFDEVPMMYPSYMVKGTYESHAYYRPCAALNILKDFLGDLEFKKALIEYMKRWNGKHPTPYDFFYTFEDITGDDLSWFWQPWFFRQGYPDLAIDSAFVTGDNLKIKITKEGELPVPVAINIRFKDGSEKKTYRSAAIWKNEDEDDIWIEIQTDKRVSIIELGNGYIPDADSTNNVWMFK